MDTFHIRENDFSRGNSKAYEGMMAQGNGYLSFRASMEEGLDGEPQNERYTRSMASVTTEVQRHPVSKWGVYIPLIMGKNPFLNDVIINLPYVLYIGMSVNGRRVDMLKLPITDYSRELDMRTGILNRRFTYTDETGTQAICEVERFASMERKHIVVQKVVWKAVNGPVDLELEPGIDGDVTTNGYRHFEEPEIVCEPVCGMTICTDQDFKAAMGFDVCMKVLNSVHPGAPLEVSSCNQQEFSTVDSRDHWKAARCIRLRLEKGQDAVLIKRSAVVTSRDPKDGERTGAECESELIRVSALLAEIGDRSYNDLKEEHVRAWERKWGYSDVVIKGNDRLQKALRFSVYHLIRSNMEFDSRVSICAKGYAGEAYYGRYFWDSEIYMLPFFIYTNPQAAKNLLLYRYHTLNGAKKNARRYNCKGARYPWQSGLDGTEQCSLWEYADNEVHITADVAYGLMHYYRATDDVEFMKKAGLEILLETARFWTCRADWDASGKAHLINVMGPDEYSPMTRDNAYTNRMVRKNLEDAVHMYHHFREKEPEWLQTLMQKTGFKEEEIQEFLHLADRLEIPFDPLRNLYLQSADFEDYAEIDLEAVWQDHKKPFGWYASQEKIYRSRCIKQADVLALMTLLPGEFSDEEAESAYRYYLPYTTHDSSLSPAVHLSIANRLGKDKDVDNFLNLAMDVDLSPERKGTEDGIHIANCGCLWQAVIMEFAGLKSAVETDRLMVSPRLPAGLEKISFQIWWHGDRYRITVTKEGAVTDEIQDKFF